MSDLITICRFLYWGTTKVLIIVPISCLLSLLIGSIIGNIQSVRIPVLNQLAWIYMVIMRGIPPLLLLLIVFFSLNFEIPIMAAIITLGFYHGAYISEIIRGGIAALPKGQFEAADTLALHFHQKVFYVIMPQVWKSVLPSITGQYIMLVKDTVLVSAIGVTEILNNAKLAMQVVNQPIFIYFLVGCLYFVLCFSLERIEVMFQNRLGKMER